LDESILIQPESILIHPSPDHLVEASLNAAFCGIMSHC
jgi:hypothetical protein